MSEGAYRGIRQLAVGSESTTIYSTPGAFTNPRGIEGFEMSATREDLPDERHVNDRKSNYAAHIGQKTGSCSFRVPVHADLVADLEPIFTSAFGTKSANSTATFDSSGSGASFVISAGAIDPIMLFTYNSILYARPVKSTSGSLPTLTGTLAIQLGGAATTCANAATNNGALWYSGPTANTTYWQVQAGRDSESDVVNFTLKGGVTSGLTLTLDLAQRLGFDIEGSFGDWTQESGSDLDDPDGSLSGHILGYAGEAFIQDTGTPAAGTQLDISSLSINLVPEWIARNATRAPGGTVPGSARVGMKRGRFCVDGLTVTFTKASTAWVTARTNRTAYGAFFSWDLGAPGATSTADKVALWLPRVVVDRDPTYVDLDGIEGQEVHFAVEEDTALTAPYGSPVLALFSAA